jgi:hypothetical protein
MSNLSQIANRHVRDHWRDAVFIAAALLLLAVSIGSVTSRATKTPPTPEPSVAVFNGPLEIEH